MTCLIARFITRELWLSLLGTLLIVVLLISGQQWVRYLNRAVTGHLPLAAVMQLMGLQVPMLLAVLLPLALYLSILLVLGRLYTDHEMLALYAGGMQPQWLLRVVGRVALWVALIVAGLTFVVKPYLAEGKAHILAAAKRNSVLMQVTPRQFQAVAGGAWVLWAGAAQPTPQGGQRLRQVFVAKRRDAKAGGVTQVVTAQSAELAQVPGQAAPFLIFHQGQYVQGTPGQADMRVTTFAEFGLRLPVPIMNQATFQQAKWLPTLTLWRQHRQDPERAAEWHWRLALPLSVLLLAALAVPLSEVPPRQGRYARLLPAVLWYVLYLNLLFVGRSAIMQGQPWGNWGLYPVHVLMLLVTLFYNRKLLRAWLVERRA